MKKNWVIISIFAALIAIIVFLINYGFLIVFWLTTPGDGELRPEEKILFEKIKKRSNASDIQREPKYHISNPKDTIAYSIIINNISCHKIINKDSLEIEALKIKSEIDKFKLHRNFYKYEIIYECKNGEEILYSYPSK